MPEQIRTYTHADFRRATNTLTHARSFDPANIPYEGYTLEVHNQRASVLEIANEMYDVHTGWTNKKFDGVRPYLQRQPSHRTNDEAVTRHFRAGLQSATELLSLHTPGRVDLQDAVAGFTHKFVSMLKKSERLGVNPDTALVLAEKSHLLDENAVAELFEDNSDLPQRAVERAATLSTSGWRSEEFLGEYRTIYSHTLQLLGDERYADYPLDVVAEGGYRRRDPFEIMMDRRRLERRGSIYSLDDFPGPKGYHIDINPRIRQRHKNWCGYSTLAMAMQHYGYRDITPERLFTHEYGYYDGILEYIDPSEGPSIDTLALIATELTPLKARVVKSKDYPKLQERNPALKTPEDVLQAFLKKDVPVIVRYPGHYMLATGYNPDTDYYSAIDPMEGKEVRVSGVSLEGAWGRDENREYQHDGKHLMLVLTPPRKE